MRNAAIRLTTSRLISASFSMNTARALGILMETEIWPNLMHGCREAGVPLFLANARLSEKSQQGYLKIRPLVAPALAGLRGCYAQTAADAERLHFIGASNVHVCGNSKYDITPSETMHACGGLQAAHRQQGGGGVRQHPRTQRRG